MANVNWNSSVTDQIMDYCLKYGQNSNLEKFLRLRANTTRSSSDGSIPIASGVPEEINQRNVTRSLENLSTLQKQAKDNEWGRKSAELLQNRSDGSDRSKTDQQKKENVPKDENTQKQKENIVISQKKIERKSARNLNFNMESVIEINLPQMLEFRQLSDAPMRKDAIVPTSLIHEICSTSTQTMPEERSVEQQTEEPIQPIMKPNGPKNNNLNVEEINDTTRDISPGSSITSNKQRLEWDSLGDIGYNSSDKLYFCSAGDLNETEKRCLQKYFAKKGLNLDTNVVVVKNVQPRAKNVDLSVEKTEAKRKAKQKWEEVYRKYKEKYPNSSEISLTMMNPDAQSTPKVEQFQMVPQKAIKSTQTSVVEILSKEVQAELHHVQSSDMQIQTEMNSLKTDNIIPANGKTSTYEEIEIVDSFEFFSSPPSERTETAISSNQHIRPLSSSNVSNSCKSSSESPSSQRQQLSSSSVSGNATNGSNPEIVYNFEDELRLGVTLYNTICESRSLPSQVKKSLIDKIFRKIMKNDPKGRTKEQLLSEYACNKQRQTLPGHGNGKTEKQYDSTGVEKLASNQKSLSVSSSGSSKGVDEVIVEIVESRDVNSKTNSNSEDHIVYNLQEQCIESNQTGNPKQRRESITSSHRTSSSKSNGLHHTARKLHHTDSSSSNPSDDPNDRIHRAMGEYLKPMTNSEIDYANQQELKQKQRRSQKSEDDNTMNELSKEDKIIELFRKEKQSQLLKINKKIEHLKTMKLLLLEEQKTINKIGTDIPSTYRLQPKSRTTQIQSLKEKENIYEHAEGHEASVYSSVGENTTSDQSNGQNAEHNLRSSSESEWNSHYHMSKMIKNRSKLKTPTSDESIATYIKNRKEKFIEDYKRHRRQMFEEQQHIYTKPYSGYRNKQDHCSGLSEKYSIRNIASSKTYPVGSEEFISTNSISIPAANTLTNTTTHQYDIKSSRTSSKSLPIHAIPVGTQTTESILKTKPIFESNSRMITSDNAKDCKCPCRYRPTSEHTGILDDTQPKLDKQQQVQPNPIAYVITFDDKGKGRKQPSEKEQVYQLLGSTDSSTNSDQRRITPSEDTELLSLKEQFQRNCPGTLMRLKERQKCVEELNKLRLERNKQRKKLLLLTSDDSLKKNDAKGRLPPPPLAQRRIFSSKAIRENTRRFVRNLPEVLRKREMEKNNDIKRKNLILRDKFNRNLQRKVLHGQVDLSNSIQVMRE